MVGLRYFTLYPETKNIYLKRKNKTKKDKKKKKRIST